MIQRFKGLSYWCKVAVSVFTGVIMLLGVGATFAAIEDRFAKQAEMKRADAECLQKALENAESIRIVSNSLQIEALQRRIWALQSHYEGQPIPPHIQQEIQYLQQQIRQLQGG